MVKFLQIGSIKCDDNVEPSELSYTVGRIVLPTTLLADH
jgi:hypothetical protein